jgi:pimeloyl-ACP methyl ester carboxylesterase
VWNFFEIGSGEPLVLLHGLGMSNRAWGPVIPYLRPTCRVIAFDIAGFGRTPPLPCGTPPNVSNLVDGLEQSMRAMGLEKPVNFAGNSLGGLMALEAARRGLARRVVAISPPGLWRRQPPHHVKYVFGALHFMATHAPTLVKTGMRSAVVRELTLAVPLSIGSRRMSVQDAVGAVDDLAASTAFAETFRHTRTPFAAPEIDGPVTVAFGDRDWILLKGARLRERLPPRTRWIEKPGWGHVPMWIDPAGVAQVILEGTRQVFCNN